MKKKKTLNLLGDTDNMISLKTECSKLLTLVLKNQLDKL